MYYDEDNVATLIIREVFPEDAGTFTCVAKNAAGFASSTTELIVEAPLSDHGSDVTGLSRKSLSRYALLILSSYFDQDHRLLFQKIVGYTLNIHFDIIIVCETCMVLITQIMNIVFDLQTYHTQQMKMD